MKGGDGEERDDGKWRGRREGKDRDEENGERGRKVEREKRKGEKRGGIEGKKREVKGKGNG